MKKLILTSIAAISIYFPNAYAETVFCKKNTNLHIDLAAKKLNFNLRESVNLTVTITNNGGDPVLLNPFMEPESYWLRFEVTNQNNERMGWLGPEVKIIETDNRVTLEEGYYWGRSYIGFEKLYDLSKVGNYKIRAIYGVGPDGKCPSGIVLSNSLKLRVD